MGTARGDTDTRTTLQIKVRMSIFEFGALVPGILSAAVSLWVVNAEPIKHAASDAPHHSRQTDE